jgi:UDP-N-acetylmuramoyl-L-alanyl-D-glutamate--2,6-diaminopimelate ligase
MLPTAWPVTCHTDMVGPGSIFIAIEGTKESGTRYIPLALERGATHIVLQENAPITAETIALIQQAGAQYSYVHNAREALAELSAQAHGYPADKLCLIGITGTKGKTTCAWLTWHLLRSQGYSAALLSTVHNKINDTVIPTGLTTPHPDYLHTFFATCLQQGVTHVVMEVAAQALSLHRLDGIFFDLVLFTNFSHEHSEFYATLDEYLSAKEQLFLHRKPGAPALVCIDTPAFRAYKDRYENCFTISAADPTADYYWQLSHSGLDGIKGSVHIKNEAAYEIKASLIGAFNGINSACALALCHMLKLSLNDALKAFAQFEGVPGRAEFFKLSSGALCCIDYAHNPNSIHNILTALRPLGKRLIVVTGAGGERDIYKRPLMAQVAAEIADVLILTSDNPRSEDPADIVAQMCAGIPANARAQIMIEIDRAQALQIAHVTAHAGDVVALLGKGPDHYQLIKGIKYPFNERSIISAL